MTLKKPSKSQKKMKKAYKSKKNRNSSTKGKKEIQKKPTKEWRKYINLTGEEKNILKLNKEYKKMDIFFVI